ncbi:hypothetical protein Ddye_015333 [Dipteronia dyeriana]|uniref:RING-type domain-containing protein n=1 Tax=Dipteronia dyeriana TaxID=168575 RepID=A0AAD9U588_9ROSI|nr:hypothetical protein Ddye_015333 [Dipteronia dyeriana]
MGISSLPSPSEGMLCVIIVNTALSISIVKGIVRSILQVVGIHLSESETPSYWTDASTDTTQSVENQTPCVNHVEEFRNRNPAIKFDTLPHYKHSEHECSVCLTRFEPESDINKLSCGHFFHKACLEKWLGYWNITCPLCRTPLISDELEEDVSCIW